MKVEERWVEASQRSAEFGNDIFLHLLEKSYVTVDEETGERTIEELALVFHVRCPSCDSILRLDDSLLGVDTAYCTACGEEIVSLDDCKDVRDDED
jgi:hypothetical protein